VSDDISKILSRWEFVPGEVNVRSVEGDDGREKIQLRLDLGVIQLEVDGRPDGTQIEGCPSWLDFFSDRQQEHDRENPDSAPFMLDAEDCEHLLREAIQYYHRYLSFWHLGRYELCARDTNRNLNLLAFVREFAGRPQDKMQFDQWRPYITMMHARAVAAPLVELGDVNAAIKVIEVGIGGIEAFLQEYDQAHRADECRELVHLRAWRDQLSQEREQISHENEKEGQPQLAHPLASMRAQLQAAIEAENYEEAARLRDEIRRWGESPLPPGPGGVLGG
jgi:hypothetical protein